MSAVFKRMIDKSKTTGKLAAEVGYKELAKHCKCDVKTVYNRLARFRNIGVFKCETQTHKAGQSEHAGKRKNIYLPGPNLWEKPIGKTDRENRYAIFETDRESDRESDRERITHDPRSQIPDPNTTFSEIAKFPEYPESTAHRIMARHYRKVQKWYLKYDPEKTKEIRNARRQEIYHERRDY